MEKLPLPKTLQEAVRFFSDDATSHAYAMMLRWPDGYVTCPRCDSDDHAFTESFVMVRQKNRETGEREEVKKARYLWRCRPCNKQFTVKVNTVMEDSPIGLDKWMVGMWCLANDRNGISSCEFARAVGITQKSAWHLLHRLRLAIQNGNTVRLGGNSGEVEVDETFIGGKGRFMHADKKRRVFGAKYLGAGAGKVAIQGLLERHGEVRARVVGHVRHKDLVEGVMKHVQPGAQVYSDEIGAYRFLPALGYEHAFVHHAERYVDGKVHTNSLENFWSLLKRGLKGTYVSVEPYHLFRYVDEQSFRFNHRKNADNKPTSDLDRFRAAMAQVSGKRLTYKKLTGKEREILA